ncbi:unnamed protein product [Arctogadus glacialis]
MFDDIKYAGQYFLLTPSHSCRARVRRLDRESHKREEKEEGVEERVRGERRPLGDVRRVDIGREGTSALPVTHCSVSHWGKSASDPH